MAEIICDRCGKKFARKENLTYHIEHDACKPADFICKYCKKRFTKRNSMHRHTKHSCKMNPERNNDIDDNKNGLFDKITKLEKENKSIREKLEKDNNIREKLEKSNEELQKKLEIIMEQLMKSKNQEIIDTEEKNINNGTIYNGPVNNTVINMNNVTLVAYGKEDMSKINKDELVKILKNGFNSSIRLTEALHFNPSLPEYHNIYISNMKDKYAMIYDGTNWNLTMKETLIDRIYDDKKNYIEQNLEQFVESLRPSQMNALKRWIDTDDDTPKIKSIKEEIKLLLYNKKDMPLKSQVQVIQNKTKKTKKEKVLKIN